MILFSTTKSSKKAENHSTIKELETTAYLASKCYICIRKYCRKESISCIGKIHHPHKIQGPLGNNAPFRFAGAAKNFKPCGLEQRLREMSTIEAVLNKRQPEDTPQNTSMQALWYSVRLRQWQNCTIWNYYRKRPICGSFQSTGIMKNRIS